MNQLPLQLSNLSLSTTRSGDLLTSIKNFNNGDMTRKNEVSFPDAGVKYCFGGPRGEERIDYIFIFLQKGTKDWLCRLNGVDNFGATYSAYSSDFMVENKTITDEFLKDPISFLNNCSLFQLYREEHDSISFILKNTFKDPRIVLRYTLYGVRNIVANSALLMPNKRIQATAKSAAPYA